MKKYCKDCGKQLKWALFFRDKCSICRGDIAVQIKINDRVEVFNHDMTRIIGDGFIIKKEDIVHGFRNPKIISQYTIKYDTGGEIIVKESRLRLVK